MTSPFHLVGGESPLPNPLEGIKLPDPDRVYNLLARRIVEGSNHAVKVEALAEALGEIEMETQIIGASFLKVELIDPDWKIVTSGLIDLVSEAGEGLPQRLAPVEIEYPHGSRYKWILCAVELTTEPGQPQILTFEDIAVQRLREQYGPLLTRPGTKTQAEFVEQLLRGAGVESYNPSKKTVQPIASKEEQALNEQFISTEIERKSATRHANKQPGVNAGSKLTIEGVALDRQQLDDVNTALSIAEQEKAGRTATLALLIAGIVESGFRRTAENKEPTQTDMGIWQSDQIPGDEVEKQAAAFLKGGSSFGAGGAIAKAREGKKPGEIAKEVEVSQPEPAVYEKHLPEAEAWLAARGGVGDEGSAGESTGESGESRVGLLHRGSKENPTESSFECITKLAQEVDFYFFTKNDRGYYMSGVDLIRQEPVLYVNVPKNIVRYADGTEVHGALTIPTTADWDNTTYYYQLGKKLKERIARKSKLTPSQSPSEIRLSLICEETTFEAGQVFVFEGSGPLNGRWVVVDTVRLCMSEPYTTITLQPPKDMLPEPARTKAEEEEVAALGLSGPGGSTSASAASTGSGKQGVVAAAKKALSEKAKYKYREYRPMPGSLFGAVPREMDCSTFATLTYKAANEPDPNGLNYNGEGYTGTLWAHGTETNNPQPGDLVFYGSEHEAGKTGVFVPVHVTVYIGGGQVISMGQEGDPSQGPAASMGPAPICGYRTYS